MSDFTIADVLAWAKTKPADQAYNYENPDDCALCRFLRDTGRAVQPAVSPSFGWGERGRRMSSRHPYDLTIEPALRTKDWTFGALVKRLEALCPDTPVTPSNWLTIDAYLSASVPA